MQNIENKMQENVKKFQSLGWNVRGVEVFRFASQHDCLKMVAELTGLKEGVVVYNTLTKERVKIKNATYLAAHRLRGNGLTLNAICELVVMNEVDEYIAVFPEDEDKFIDAKEMFATMIQEMCNSYDVNRFIDSQKDFALAVKGLPLSNFMFLARKTGTDVLRCFNSAPTAKKAQFLKEQLLK